MIRQQSFADAFKLTFNAKIETRTMQALANETTHHIFPNKSFICENYFPKPHIGVHGGKRDFKASDLL